MSAKSRALKAITMIVAKKTDSRAFDDLFEAGDGDEVVSHIINRIRQNHNERTAVASWHGGELIDGMPASWVETYNRILGDSLFAFAEITL